MMALARAVALMRVSGLSSSGLRKLEAFFGFLITIMAVSFGYEVQCSCSMFSVGECVSARRVTCLYSLWLVAVCASGSRPGRGAEGHVFAVLQRLWTHADGAGRGDRGSRHNAS